MSKTLSKMVMALGTMSLLSGCQTFSQSMFAKKGDFDTRAQQRNNALYTQRGTEYLRAGSNGLAIEAFNLAIATGEEPAPAYNGLGVAYARLDRPDLAYRFFKKATMGAPDNPVFARNFALLLDSPSYAVAVAKQRQAQKIKPPIEKPAPDQVGLATKTAREAGKLYRDENRQFSLVTVPAQPVSIAQTDNRQRNLCQPKQQSVRAGICVQQRLPETVNRTSKPRDLAAKENRQTPNQLAPGDNASSSDGTGAPKEKSKTVIMPVASRETSAQPVRRSGAEEPNKLRS